MLNAIYVGSKITVASNDEWTNQIDVGKGVLQGDSCSPVLFNLCFNLLMQTLAKPELQNLGFISRPERSISKFPWLQFADDAVIQGRHLRGAGGRRPPRKKKKRKKERKKRKKRKKEKKKRKKKEGNYE